MLKNRNFSVLFLYDFEHLPWMLLLNKALFHLKVIIAKKWSYTPPGKGTRNRPRQLLSLITEDVRNEFTDAEQLKAKYMTASSIIYRNVHITKSHIEFEFMPEVPNYEERYQLRTPWRHLEKINGVLEYDRRTTVYLEKFTLRKVTLPDMGYSTLGSTP